MTVEVRAAVEFATTNELVPDVEFASTVKFVVAVQLTAAMQCATPLLSFHQASQERNITSPHLTRVDRLLELSDD